MSSVIVRWGRAHPPYILALLQQTKPNKAKMYFLKLFYRQNKNQLIKGCGTHRKVDSLQRHKKNFSVLLALTRTPNHCILWGSLTMSAYPGCHYSYIMEIGMNQRSAWKNRAYLKSALKLQRNNIVPETRLRLPTLWNGLWRWKNLLTAAGILKARKNLSCCVFVSIFNNYSPSLLIEQLKMHSFVGSGFKQLPWK